MGLYMDDALAKLFGSAARLKLLRLFLFNPEESITVVDAAFRAKVSKEAARKEVRILADARILKKRNGKGPAQFSANVRFPHYEPLRTFLRTSTGVNDESINSLLKKSGTIRLVTLSGLFTGVPEPGIDILVVGDRLDDKALNSAVHSLEAELGRELRYAAFSTEDFRYRIGVYDRLLRDIFDYPHRVILDKIGV
jgi:predicted nucleotidyltransferase